VRPPSNDATANHKRPTIPRATDPHHHAHSSDASGADGAYLNYDLLFHLQSMAVLERLTGPSAQSASSLLRFAIDSMRETEEKHVRLAVAVAAGLEGTCGSGGD
jgi:hypothetical protein